ncbi:MAG: hypothetical protein ACFFCS_10530 [Candidatus Hodarchaeota archaeon]
MKLVIQRFDDSIVEEIKEHELESTISEVKSSFFGEEIEPLQHELFRYKTPHGVVVIYKDNKVLRTKNFWYEFRGLSILAKHMQCAFRHGVKLQFPDGQETEVDGLDVESGTIMVEAKKTKITQEWIDFYEGKRKRLNFKECLVLAPKFEDDLEVLGSIKLFQFRPDVGTLLDFYNDDFEIPDWFAPHVSSRHVRVLLSNGRWYGIRRKLTTTAKHTPRSKLLMALNTIAGRRLQPIRVYYTLCPMVRPVYEFHGWGHPFKKIIAAFDVDSDHGVHVIGKEGHCLQCLDESTKKVQLIEEKLTDDGWEFIRIHSGSKGFHVYLMDPSREGKVFEMEVAEYFELVKELQDEDGNYLTDNWKFRMKDGSFDLHRIFKFPGSVDVATGVKITPKLEKLQFNDKLEEIN